MPTTQCAFAYDHCKAANPAQNNADPAYLLSIGVDEVSAKRMIRCSYCGGHWSYEENGNKRRRGYVENGQWVSVCS